MIGMSVSVVVVAQQIQVEVAVGTRNDEVAWVVVGMTAEVAEAVESMVVEVVLVGESLGLSFQAAAAAAMVVDQVLKIAGALTVGLEHQGCLVCLA